MPPRIVEHLARRLKSLRQTALASLLPAFDIRKKLAHDAGSWRNEGETAG